MKIFGLLLVALLPLAASGQSAAEPKLRSWLLARQMATCESDNRRLPIGTRICTEGHVWVCAPSGNWQNSGKAC